MLFRLLTFTAVAAASASVAAAQQAAPSPTPAPASTQVASGPDRIARIEGLVDSACGKKAASGAPADQKIYAECRSSAQARAEQFVH